MTGRHIAFDAGASYCANDCISAIGITVIDEGAVAEQYDYLVNSEIRFALFYIAFTGNAPKMEADKPALPQLRQELKPVWSSSLLATITPFK